MSFMTVSYTHLDVYKRQLQCLLSVTSSTHSSEIFNRTSSNHLILRRPPISPFIQLCPEHFVCHTRMIHPFQVVLSSLSLYESYNVLMLQQLLRRPSHTSNLNRIVVHCQPDCPLIVHFVNVLHQLSFSFLYSVVHRNYISSPYILIT